MKDPTDYRPIAAGFMAQTLDFVVLAKGLNCDITGTLVGFVPAKSSLLDARALRADPKLLEDFAGAATVRTRADVCVFRTINSANGKAKFYTPRPQQVRWPK